MRDWNEHYRTGELPWDTGEPAPALVELVEAGRLPRGRAIDIGCGTGTNALYLAGNGYDVVGVDFSPLAIEAAQKKGASSGSVSFHAMDFLNGELPAGKFDLAFDRGCLHVFDDPADQKRFAERVAGLLAPEGLWVSLLGSTEGAPRDEGPPRRSARDIALAIEPSLAIVELRAIQFDVHRPVSAWMLIAQQRSEPAQPSTAGD